MGIFTVGSTIKINGSDFTITKVEPCVFGTDHYELTGTKQGDPSFLVGKRTVFTKYLHLTKQGKGYTYDWNAK